MNVDVSCEIPFRMSKAMAIANGGHFKAAFLNKNPQMFQNTFLSESIDIQL